MRSIPSFQKTETTFINGGQLQIILKVLKLALITNLILKLVIEKNYYSETRLARLI